MAEIRVASRYARSLFELAKERNEVEAVHADVRGMLEMMKGNRPFARMLESPVISTSVKNTVVDKVLSGQLSPMVMHFIKIVLRKRREAILPMIFEQFEEMYRRLNNIVLAEVKTAVELDARLLDEIRMMVEQKTGKKVYMNAVMEPALLGGFVVRYEDKVIDASVSTQLRHLRKQLTSAN